MDKRLWDFDSTLEFNDDDLIPVAIDNGDGTYTTMNVSGAILREYINPETPTPNLGPVLDNTITNPSALTPTEGDRYIVPIGAINDWLGQDDNIAQWDGFAQEWTYYIPVDEDKTIVTTGTNAGKVYEYDSSLNVWNEVIVPVINNTPFFLAGTTIDAGNNKTSRISRTGDVLIGSTSSSLNAKLAINGKTIANAYATRTGFASTLDITRTGKWFRIMSFDFRYSTFAAHHFKIILGFNGNSNGSGFIAELDINIKRQYVDIFIGVVINQSKTTTELVYDTDKNIEFLWNNTTKRVTMYFRPDENYSSLSLTMLNPKETASTRFSFLNQYLNATDLTGEVNNSFNEKNIIIADTCGTDSGSKSLKRKLFDESTENTTLYLQNVNNHIFTSQYGDGSFSSSMNLNQERLMLGVADNTNAVLNNLDFSYSSNYFNLYDSTNQIQNELIQDFEKTQNTIQDFSTTESSVITQDKNAYTINFKDVNNSIDNTVEFNQNQLILPDQYNITSPTGAINIIAGNQIITLSYLPSYVNDAAADADTNLSPGSLYKLTGSRAVYQKP